MLLQKEKDSLTSAGIPIKSGQQVKKFLDALQLPSEMAIVKIEAHCNRDKKIKWKLKEMLQQIILPNKKA